MLLRIKLSYSIRGVYGGLFMNLSERYASNTEFPQLLWMISAAHLCLPKT